MPSTVEDISSELLLIDGRSDVIVCDDNLDVRRAKRHRLSEHDLLEDLRLNGNGRDIRDVALAVLERNGHIKPSLA